MIRNYALGWSVHFLTEKQNEPYRQYGEVSIAGEKCAERQEHLNKDRLVLFLERCAA